MEEHHGDGDINKFTWSVHRYFVSLYRGCILPEAPPPEWPHWGGQPCLPLTTLVGQTLAERGR